jgi:sortase B
MGIYKKFIRVFIVLMVVTSCTNQEETGLEKPELSASESLKDSIQESTDVLNKESSISIVDSEYTYIENPSQELLEKNPDYSGWIRIENTTIDEPIVKGIDNEFYLDRDFNKKKDKYGTVFMDYRNIGFEFSANTILYGHNAKNRLRFGPLEDFLDKTLALEASTITIQTLYDTYTYDIFAFYFDVAEPSNIQTRFSPSATFSQYLEDVSAKSLYDYEIEVTESDQILTLVTCSYDIDDGRYFIHAKKR